MAPTVYQTSPLAAARLGWKTVAALAAATAALLLLISLSSVTVPVTATAGSGDPFTAAEAWAAEAAPNFGEVRAAGLEREASLPPLVPLTWLEAGSLVEGQEATGRLTAPTDVAIDVKPGWRVWAVSADGSEREIRSGRVDHKVVAIRVRNKSCGPNPVRADSAVVVRQARE